MCQFCFGIHGYQLVAGYILRPPGLCRGSSLVLFELKCFGWGWHLPFANGPMKSQLLSCMHSGHRWTFGVEGLKYHWRGKGEL